MTAVVKQVEKPVNFCQAPPAAAAAAAATAATELGYVSSSLSPALVIASIAVALHFLRAKITHSLAASECF